MMVLEKKSLLPFVIGLFLFLIFISYLITLPSAEINTSILQKALRNNQFVDATLISVGISSQVSIHLIFETLSPRRPHMLVLATRWSVNVAYTVTNIVYWIALRCDTMTGRLYFTFQFVLMSLISFALIGNLHLLDPDVWTRGMSMAITGLMALHYVFTFHNNHVISFDSFLGVMAFITYILANALAISCAYSWYYKHLHKRKFSALKLQDKLCFIRMCSLATVFLSVAFVSAYYGRIKLEDLDLSYVTIFSYIISANFLVFSIAYTKKVHAELEAAQASVSVCVISSHRHLIDLFPFFDSNLLCGTAESSGSETDVCPLRLP